MCISYNTGKGALPDIYTRRPRTSGHISGKAQGQHHNQHATPWHHKNLPKPEVQTLTVFVGGIFIVL